MTMEKTKEIYWSVFERKRNRVSWGCFVVVVVCLFLLTLLFWVFFGFFCFVCLLGFFFWFFFFWGGGCKEQCVVMYICAIFMFRKIATDFGLDLLGVWQP